MQTYHKTKRYDDDTIESRERIINKIALDCFLYTCLMLSTDNLW